MYYPVVGNCGVISISTLKNCFMMNLKLQKAVQRHFVFVESYAFMRCMTFSNVPYVF